MGWTAYIPCIWRQYQDLLDGVDGLWIQALGQVDIRQLRPRLGVGGREVEELHES
jgi:hypothetical protein